MKFTTSVLAALAGLAVVVLAVPTLPEVSICFFIVDTINFLFLATDLMENPGPILRFSERRVWHQLMSSLLQRSEM
jgi:hypothetical protein